MEFIVAGGGICGLTTAIALIRLGHGVRVFEAATELREAGAGVVLGARAMRALDALGIHDAVRSAGSEITSMSLCERNGRLIANMETERFTRQLGYRNTAIHRADLQRILLEYLPDSTVQLGSVFERFEQQGPQVTARFEGNTKVTADGLLAAEGLRSRARLQAIPGSQPRFAGYTCWRGVADASALRLPSGRSVEFWGGADRFGYVPLGDCQVYWFACTNSRMPNDPAYRNWRRADLQDRFAGFPFPVPELLSQTPDNQLLWNDILDIRPLKTFAYGRVLLLGDAAHATTPNLGQGAGQAVEDAAMLSRCLQETASPPEAFLEFDKRRRPRTTKIVKMSWQLGKLAHLQSPWLINLRNRSMRCTPRSLSERQMAFLYEE